MADFAAARAHHAADLAHRIGREIVVQHEVLLVGALEGVDELFVLAGAERGDDHRLRFAAGEQRRAMGSRQNAHLADDGAHGLEVAPVDAPTSLEDRAAHDAAFDRLEQFAERVRRDLAFFLAHQFGRGGGADGIDALVARAFLRNLIGRLEVVLDDAGERCLLRRIIVGLDLARFLRRLLGQADDGVDHLLHLAMPEHHRAQHDVLGEFLGFRFHHQHGVGGAGNDEVEIAGRHLPGRRVQPVFAADVADARSADGPHEGNARQRQRRGRRHQRHHIGIVFEIVRQHGDDDLGLVAPAGREQRTDRAVDQARDQRLAFGGPPSLRK